MSDWLTQHWHAWITVSPGRVFTVRYPPRHSLSETISVFDAIEAISAAADQDYAFIIDFGTMSRSDAKGRAHVAESETRINAMSSVQRHCRGVALVVHNAMQRGVLTAISWFARRPYDYHVAASLQEAQAWTADRMRTKSAQETG